MSHSRRSEIAALVAAALCSATCAPNDGGTLPDGGREFTDDARDWFAFDADPDGGPCDPDGCTARCRDAGYALGECLPSGACACGDPGADADADADADPDLEPGPDADADGDAGVDAAPECTTDDDCGGASYGCLAGICRVRCNWLVNPCDWSPSGNICHGGLCVECDDDADCPGTRYTCDPATFLCVDRPFDPSVTKIGVFYHTWHCPAATHVHDLTEILAGRAPYGDYNESHWWGQPAAGYYCLTDNTALLTSHAELLRDLGADFVFVDVTNHPYNTGTLCDRPEQMILEPFRTMVNVWSGIAGAPRIVPWVPVTAASSSDTRRYMVFTLLELLNAHPGLQFEYLGRPLILVTENAQWPVDEATVASLAADYTIRRMWAYEADGTARWSYLENCESSPLDPEPCFQRMASSGGGAEQLPISMAYQADYMSHRATATPKHHGRTFRRQFETLFDNPEVPIATITGWNEWLVGRYRCDVAPLCVCSNPEDVNGCFLDQYDIEYNRDIEPANNELGTYYYDLVRSCIELFRAGERCTPDNDAEPCCSDWEG